MPLSCFREAISCFSLLLMETCSHDRHLHPTKFLPPREMRELFKPLTTVRTSQNIVKHNWILWAFFGLRSHTIVTNMNKTAKEYVKRGKKRKKVAPAQVEAPNEKKTFDNTFALESPRSNSTVRNTQDREKVEVKNSRSRRLPPIAPLVAQLPQTNDTEILELKNGSADITRHVDTSSEVDTGSLPVVRTCTEIAFSPATTRRRNENMTSYERMLQREKRRSRKKSVRSYTILHMETEDQETESIEGSTLHVVEDDAVTAQSSVSVRSRCSSLQDPNQGLLKYVAKLSSSPNLEDSLDLEYIKSLIREGASVNTCDRFGQTLLHEVSKTWGIEVAQFFIEQGADINKADDYGRTPLHVAASADYSEMVKFLIDNGADLHMKTAGEDQTPLHYAAKNEANQCVKILLVCGADIDARDYKLRTPLQVAAEYNSAEATRTLLDEGASAGVKDNSGLSALSLLISQMPVVAYKALDQFHSVDRIHRKQHFYLNFLESCHSPKGCNTFAPSPLQAVSQSNCLELIMHPIFQRLIDVKWRYFRAEAWLDILPNVLMAILYTILACSVPQNVDNFYTPLSKNWWKIVIAIVFLAITLNEIRKEGKEYYRSKKQSKKLMKWRRKEVERDFAFCHPRWPQERNFVEQELKRIKQDKGNNYFSDAWNFVDIITYAMLVVVTILHMSSVFVENNLYHDVFIRILSCSVIPVWVRLLKYARPFPNQGPFVVMLDHIVKDSAKWLLVIMMIYIPYGAAFWIMYGQNSQTPVKGYNDTTSLIFTMLRMPLLDDYNFAQLEKAAPYMARVLCGSFIIISAIVLMNLYIALLSNTFQRVYDNARATAAIQRARLLQDLELDTSENKLRRYREYIRENYSPEENDYIAFFSEEEEQSRRQDEKVSEIHNIVGKRFGGKKFGKLERSEFDSVLDDLDMLKRSHAEIRRSLSLLTSNLEELTRSNALIVDERNRIDRFQEQEHVLKRLDCTVARIEAVYDIDNGRNPGKPQRYHKANQTE